MAVKEKPKTTTKKSTSSVKKTPTKNTTTKKTATTSRAKPKTAQQLEQEKIAKARGRSLILFVVSIFLIFLIFLSGASVWNWLHTFILGLFGYCAILWPIFLIYIAVLLESQKDLTKAKGKLVESAVLVVLITTACYLFSGINSGLSFFSELGYLYTQSSTGNNAGLFSGLLGIPLIYLLGDIGAKITIIILIFAFFMLMTGIGVIELFKVIVKPFKMIKEMFTKLLQDRANRPVKEKPQKPIKEVKKESFKEPSILPQKEEMQETVMPSHPIMANSQDENLPQEDEQTKKERLERLKELIGGENTKPKEENTTENISQTENNSTLNPIQLAQKYIKEQSEKQNNQVKNPTENSDLEVVNDESLRYPPIVLLEENTETVNTNIERELTKTSQHLLDTLKSFGVTATLLDVSRGPAVTRYELKPASGVKISKITNLADDIALNLASAGVRIEAPIPNKPAVGIEVPNEVTSIVKMKELIESDKFKNATSKLTVVLGKDITGNVTIADLAKMPHTLIAGATGSGKSVCINSLIISLLYKATSDEVKFLMIDPKVVELGVYNGIPHLLVPVVTEARKAAGALGWAVTEMLKRYRIFAENNVRDLTAYNKHVKNKGVSPEGEVLMPLPQIVIIIDELADLMMAAPNEVEDSICRLAQMARAAGMHLVIATQRPTVDVITGTIKANVPSRIAFSVKSQIDSRTILDTSGADRLLGRGDMLYSPIGANKPVRIQGCYVTDEEIEKVVSYVKEMGVANYDEEIANEIERQTVKKKGEKELDIGEDSDVDPMMAEAIKCVVEAGQASTSMLQRRLRLGYARAGRIIDQMAQKGIIGPSDGSKPRQVLISKEQYLEMTMGMPSEEIPKND